MNKLLGTLLSLVLVSRMMTRIEFSVWPVPVRLGTDMFSHIRRLSMVCIRLGKYRATLWVMVYLAECAHLWKSHRSHSTGNCHLFHPSQSN